MKYKAIIFDMDGTIVDTEKIWHVATTNLIKSKDVEISPELENELKKLRGLALIKSCKIIKDLINIKDSVEDLISQKSELAQQLYKNEQLKYIDGFLKFHGKLSVYNLKTGIATNADDHTLKLTKEALNLEELFGQHIYNISHVNNMYKPHPDIYIHVAKQLNVKPEECLAIEDSEHGINAAKAAQMFCIGINTAKNEDMLKKSDLIINHYDEINLESLLSYKNSTTNQK